MKNINDGGPAFPCDWKDFQPDSGIQVAREQFQGMSLRDWFAGMALQGMSNQTRFYAYDAKALDVVVNAAYSVADKMLKERENAP